MNNNNSMMICMPARKNGNPNKLIRCINNDAYHRIEMHYDDDIPKLIKYTFFAPTNTHFLSSHHIMAILYGNG